VNTSTVHQPAVEEVGDRFVRQRLVTGWDQERLAEATAVVIGVGALGNEVSKNLALAGIGRLLLCDPDTVSRSNLSRTVLFAASDRRPEGRAKVEAAAEALAMLAPHTRVEPRPYDMTAGVGMGELADADVVLGCVDSREARLELLGRCALVEATLVDGGTSAWGGEVRLRLSTAEPCYGCLLTPRERAESDTPWSCLDDPATGGVPAAIGTTALVAAWMTQVAFRLVFGLRPPFRFLTIDAVTGHTGPVVASLDERCLHHRPLGDCEPVRATAASTVEELLTELPTEAEPATWAGFPVPHERDWDGGPVRLSQRLRDAPSGTPLRRLGVAPEEILPVRLSGGGYRWLRLSR
jgi:molybdopterin-synthase adenylyltransferase